MQIRIRIYITHICTCTLSTYSYPNTCEHDLAHVCSAWPHMITRKTRAMSRLDLIGAGRRALQRWRASRQHHAARDLAVSVVGQPLCLQLEILSQKQALCWDSCSGAKPYAGILAYNTYEHLALLACSAPSHILLEWTRKPRRRYTFARICA